MIEMPTENVILTTSYTMTLGLLVLEVKDYTRGTLNQVNQDEWILRNTAGKPVTVRSSLKQAIVQKMAEPEDFLILLMVIRLQRMHRIFR